VFLELPIRGGLIPAPLIYGRPATWDGFWYVALAEQFRGSLTDPFANLPAKLGELRDLGEMELGLFGVTMVPFAALVTASRAPRYMLLTGVAMVITLLFDQAYVNADIQRYYLGPILIAWTWLAVFAAEVASLIGDVASAALARVRGSTAPEAIVDSLATAAAIVLAAILLAPAILGLEANRQAANRSGDRSAETWLDETLPAIAQNAVLVSWWSTSTPLWYAQKVEGERPDIFVVDDRTMLDLGLGRAPDVIRRYLGENRPVYAIRLPGPDTEELTDQFDMAVVAGQGSEAVWQVRGPLFASR